MIGYALLFTSLLFDGIIAIKEKSINHDVHNNPEFADYKKVLSWEYMHCFSLYTFIFSIFGIGIIRFNNFYRLFIFFHRFEK